MPIEHTPPDDDPVWHQIADALNGTLSHADQRAFDARRGRDPAFDRLVGDCERVWTALAASDRPALDVRPFQLPATAPTRVTRRRADRERTVVPPRRAVAAGVVVLSRPPRPTGSTAERPVASTTPAPAPTARVPSRHVAAAGSPTVVLLPDGSRAQLAGGSRLYVQMLPGAEQERRVQLEGTAYFTVAPDAARPFVVRAGDAVVRVTGTLFVVTSPPPSAPRRGAAALVRVVEGSVRVAPHAGGIDATLGARQEARIDVRGARVRAALGDTLAWLSFTRGEFDADDEPLAALLARLRDERGVTLALGTGVDATQRLTVHFTTEAADSVRAQLAAITGTVLRQDRGRWTLHLDASH
jgi:transmembrane sensor